MSTTNFIRCKKCSKNIEWKEIDNEKSAYNLKGICENCHENEL